MNNKGLWQPRNEAKHDEFISAIPSFLHFIMIKKTNFSFVRVKRPMKGECKLPKKVLTKKKASDD